KHDEDHVELIDPRRHVRLSAFSDALDRIRSDDDHGDDGVGRVVELRSRSPAQLLGKLALERTTVESLSEADTPHLPAVARGMRSTLHHVALIRNAELVVRYQTGSAPAGGALGYAGVFRCSLELDDVFRRSEPPTHDDWVPE